MNVRGRDLYALAVATDDDYGDDVHGEVLIRCPDTVRWKAAWEAATDIERSRFSEWSAGVVARVAVQLHEELDSANMARGTGRHYCGDTRCGLGYAEGVIDDNDVYVGLLYQLGTGKEWKARARHLLADVIGQANQAARMPTETTEHNSTSPAPTKPPTRRATA